MCLCTYSCSVHHKLTCFKVAWECKSEVEFFSLACSRPLVGKNSCWPAIAPFNFMLNWQPSRCSGSVHGRWKRMFDCGAVRSVLRLKRRLHLGQKVAWWDVGLLIVGTFLIAVGHRHLKKQDILGTTLKRQKWCIINTWLNLKEADHHFQAGHRWWK